MLYVLDKCAIQTLLTFSMLWALYLRIKVCHLQSKNHQIISGSQNPSAGENYQRITRWIEKITTLFQVFILQFLLPFNVALFMAFSIYKYIASDFSNESFLQFFPAAWVTSGFLYFLIIFFENFNEHFNSFRYYGVDVRMFSF